MKKIVKRASLSTIGVMIVLLSISMLWLHMHIPSRPADMATVFKNSRPIPAAQVVGFEDNMYSATLTRGQENLVRSITQIAPFERLILDYLQRKYGLSQDLSASHTPIYPPVQGQGENLEQFLVFRRISYPDDLIRTLPTVVNDPIDKMMMAAAYCDRIKLPKDFVPLVRSNLAVGGYNLTHVIFAMKLLNDNGCAVPGIQNSNFRNEIATKVQTLITDPSTAADLRYEAIAFLIDMGRVDLVQPSWISQIVSEQQIDGGWKQSQEAPTTSDHATILAFWALLQYTHPNAPNEPMIRRPTSL